MTTVSFKDIKYGNAAPDQSYDWKMALLALHCLMCVWGNGEK